MNTFARIVVALAVVLGASACRTPSVIRQQAPAVGRVQHETSIAQTTAEMRLVTPAHTSAVNIDKTAVTRQTVEVLEINDRAPTKIRVTYEEKTERAKEDGEDKVQVSPLTGRTYVVEAVDGRVVVTGEGPLSAVEETRVVKDYRRLGQPDPFVSAIPARELKAGEEVPELAATLAQELSRASAGPDSAPPQVELASVKVKELTEDRVVFDVVLTFIQIQGPLSAKAELTGTVSVFRDDGWPAKMALEGPLTFGPTPAAAAAGAKIEGKGSTSLRFDVVRD